MARRDYGKIAQNIAILGAHASGMAVPVAPGVALYRALRGEGAPQADKAFVGRFLEQLETWLHAPGRDRRVNDLLLAPQWRTRLETRLCEVPAVGRDAAIALLRQELFTPLIETPMLRERSDVLVRELIDALPELIVAAGDAYGAFAALRATVGADIARLERLVADLDPTKRWAGDRVLVAAYLTRLADRLNIDPWVLRDRAADPARLDAIQQHLALTDDRRETGPIAVDELVERCHRLVILGGPGSGKSWSARRAVIRAARAALATLGTLDPEAGLDEIELPLLATCAEVLEPSDQQRWDRLLNASLRRAATKPGQAPGLRDLLGRHERFLIVLDGLDEAAGVETDAIGELVDTYPGTVRVVVTSRPGSWDPALMPLSDRDSHRKGTLEPFSSCDRDAAVAAWLDDLPEVRDRLLALLQGDAVLSRQATVPLICALYCLVARPDPDTTGTDPFARFKPGGCLELYDAAIRRLLHARWRDRTSAPTGSQVARALGWLEQLAIDGDHIPDPVVGLARWPDAVVPTTDPDPDISSFVDHVAPPDPFGPDHQPTRRFVHRSLREHLFARTLCALPAPDAAERILPHLWFDPDWAEVIPTVIAAHPDPGPLLDHLRRHPAVVNDPTHALDQHLIKAATRCAPQPRGRSPRDGPINEAIRATAQRTSRTQWGHHLGGCVHWPATEQLRHDLENALAAPDPVLYFAGQLAPAFVGLAPTSPQADACAERIVEFLTTPNLTQVAANQLAEALVALAPASPRPHDLAQQIIDLLTTPGPAGSAAGHLAQALVALAPASPRPHDLADQIIELLTTPGLDSDATGQLARALVAIAPASPQAHAGAEQIIELLTTSGLTGRTAAWLVEALAVLAPASPRPHDLADQIIERLTTPGLTGRAAGQLAEALAVLAPASPQAQAGAQQIIELLTTPGLTGRTTWQLARALAVLAPASPQAQAGAQQIIKVLTTPGLKPDPTWQLAEALAVLAPASPQAHAGAQQIIKVLTTPGFDQYTAEHLARALALLAPASPRPHDLAQQIVGLLATADLTPDATKQLARALVAMDPTSLQAHASAEQIIELLTTPGLAEHTAEHLARALAVLAPAIPRSHGLAEQIVGLLATPGLAGGAAGLLAEALAALAPVSPQAHAGAEQIVKILRTPNLDPDATGLLARALAALAPASPQAHAGAEQIVKILASPGHTGYATWRLAEALVALAPASPSPDVLAQQIVERLATPRLDPDAAGRLCEALVALAPAGPQAHAGAERIVKLLTAPNLDPGARGLLATALGGLRGVMGFVEWVAVLKRAERVRLA